MVKLIFKEPITLIVKLVHHHTYTFEVTFETNFETI